MKKVAIIGAGLGSLATAIRLAAEGYKVDVYEASDSPGGKAGQIKEAGFRFDTGPSLLTMPFVLRDLYKAAGEELSDHINIVQPEVICRYFYPDTTVFNAYADLSKLINEMITVFGESGASVKGYFGYCKKIYDLTADIFLFNSFSGASSFFSFKALKTLINLRSIDSGRTMHEANSSFFRNPKTIQLFDRYATYNGSNPYQAPATLNIIQHVEYYIGGFTTDGGINKISRSLFELAEKLGVKFRFNTPVKEILLEGKVARGLVLSEQETRRYKVIVVNADVNYTYKKLLPNFSSTSGKKYATQEPSSSALVYYWGVKNENQKLEAHNIIFSADYEREFQEIFVEKTLPTDPTIYIYISKKISYLDAPMGSENWFVMVNSPYINENLTEDSIEAMKWRIIDKINSTLKINLGENIVFEKRLTPFDIEATTSSSFGSIYGISSNNKFSAFKRHPNKSKEIKNLYFCGGSAHPGGGIPLVLLSGKITAELIMKHEK